MTLTYSEIKIRYGELSTKGKNSMCFINKLRNNIQDFYLFIRLSKRQRSAIEPMLVHMGRIMSRWQNPQASLESKIFHLFTRLKNQIQPLKAAVQDYEGRFTRRSDPLKISSKRKDQYLETSDSELNQTLGGAVF